MSTAEQFELVAVDEYLDGQLGSFIKHEYVGGVLYAMAGASNRHNAIATNSLAALHARLRGRSCRPFNSDTKIRLRLPMHQRFYYPDAQVVCRPNVPSDSFQDEPVVILEVLSPATRRIDEGEKKDAYLTIPSLTAYLLVESETAAVVVFRRTDRGFSREVFNGQTAVIPLPEIEAELPLAEIYEGVDFPPEEPDPKG